MQLRIVANEMCTTAQPARKHPFFTVDKKSNGNYTIFDIIIGLLKQSALINYTCFLMFGSFIYDSQDDEMK